MCFIKKIKINVSLFRFQDENNISKWGLKSVDVPALKFNFNRCQLSFSEGVFLYLATVLQF